MQFTKTLLLVIVLASIFGLVWINTGSHVESGYATCEGGGFVPSSSLGSGLNPGGPCLGEPTTRSFSGHYQYTGFYNTILGMVIALALALYTFLSSKNQTKSRSRLLHRVFIAETLFLLASIAAFEVFFTITGDIVSRILLSILTITFFSYGAFLSIKQRSKPWTILHFTLLVVIILVSLVFLYAYYVTPTS